MKKKTILIFGYGYVSKFLSHALTEAGWQVYCTSRTPSLWEGNSSNHLKIIDFWGEESRRILQEAHAVLSTSPPQEGRDPVLETYGKEIRDGNFEWVGYLSSTGVYGDHDGRWVTEETKCEPTHEHSKVRLSMEEQWLSFYKDHKVPVHIFRIAGIYGPGRNCLEEILGGKNFTVIKKGHFFSRIHVEDICQALMASLRSPTPGEVYNVCDDEPCALEEVQQFGAHLLDFSPLKEIPIEEACLSPMAKTFFEDNKKVSNHKILQTLKIQWKYPNYRLGLQQGCLPFLGK